MKSKYKYYLVRNEGNNSYDKKVQTFKPQGFAEVIQIPKALEQEHQADLEVNDVLDEFGQSVKIVSLNQEKKAKRLAIENSIKDVSEIISKAKSVLTSTDWIVVKISEAKLLGEDVSLLLVKYESELRDRENARLVLRELG